jgi:hypothetical protein
MNIGRNGSTRNYFEEDTDFPESATKIVVAYEQAVFKAMMYSRFALQSGKSRDMQKAFWMEAVAKTFELILSGFLNEEDPIELPDIPNFSYVTDSPTL